MTQIHVLDQQTIDKIAAGEVVEKPSSVVKELTENAIDAGADRITIEVRDGGISMIRITDNGRGIAGEDIPLAFLRHATSKIQSVEDLGSLQSLGFRGEALSSIAAVSRVELITKRGEDLSAVRYVIEGGRERLFEEVGAPDGTTIVVRDIFYNTPARAKFLKSAMTEASHAAAVAEQMILSNPSVSFQFIINGQVRLSSSGSGNMKDAVFAVYGKDVVKELVSISGETEGVRLTGFIARPSVTRGNRNYENCYVNGRYIKSHTLYKAIEDGFGGRLMQHQYPFACLFLEIDGADVDVNVHPTKMEVRFSDEKKIYNLIRSAVEKAFTDLEMIADASLTIKREQTVSPGQKRELPHSEPFEKPVISDPLKAETYNLMQKAPAVPDSYEGTRKHAGGDVLRDRPDNERTLYTGSRQPSEEKDPDDEMVIRDGMPVLADQEEIPSPQLPEKRQADLSAAPDRIIPAVHAEQLSFLPAFLSEKSDSLRRMIGQVFDTYWLFEFDRKLYIMDQHAAHEKILFEQLMSEYDKRTISSQQVNPPIIVTLNAEDQAVLAGSQEAFRSLGFTVEPFGGSEFAIRAVPYDFGTIDPQNLFMNLLGQLGEISDGRISDLELYVRRVATEACKAAVKGGGAISFREAEALLSDLMKLSDPYHCPHGRPTIISITQTELEKKFKRIV